MEEESGDSTAYNEWRSLSTAASILGVVSILMGFGAASITGIYPASIFPSRHHLPRSEELALFHYVDGTPFIQDPGLLMVYSVLAVSAVILLIICGIAVITLDKTFLQGKVRECSSDPDDAGDPDTSSVSYDPEKAGRRILSMAWFAAIAISGAFIIGMPMQVSSVLTAGAIVLAILMTIFIQRIGTASG
ncbi:MAG: hypothetical protein GYA23_09765 [Methanomicrobiales archaeon]|nr:hypothetical protein [Methanomicrobiales archaeon]